ncbi:MAG TPA: Gfo/Idh/MocA family oxidoreductase [Rhizomicrobium sp.]|nr:Gfo/Idh/MocA family oxidoreductase [Rhizomicrobium sp.]
MKVAIVGIGHVARYQIDAIRHLPGEVELVGIYDGDGTARLDIPCRFHRSLDELIENSPADVVVVSTNNSDHFGTASRLINAGRAVMVEKPVCENRDDLRRLQKLAHTRNLFFHAAFHAAFGLDLLWWMEQRANLSRRYGAVTHFDMGFYDPYIDREGAVRKGARGLGGSWYDSGINALSVLARIADPGSIEIESANMFASAHIPCEQVNGGARLNCLVDGFSCAGEINTDWSLGLDRKMTVLSYERATLFLDHSLERVVIWDGRDRPETISLQNGQPRLTNHYVGVFADLKDAFAQKRDNSLLSAQLHELLFAAVEQKSAGRQNPVRSLLRSAG